MKSMAYLSFCEHDKMKLSIIPKNIAEFFPQFLQILRNFFRSLIKNM